MSVKNNQIIDFEFSEIKKTHDSSFQEVRSELEKFYEKYQNKEKIIILVNIYLYQLLSSIYTHNLKIIESLVKKKNNSFLRECYLIDFGINFETRSKYKMYSLLTNFLLIKIINLTNKLELGGGLLNSFKNKLLMRVSYSFIYNIHPSSSLMRKNTFFKIIEKYLTRCKSKIRIQITNIALIEKLVPSIFYYDQFITNLKKDEILEVNCLPVNFLHFDGDESIFFLDKQIKINGFQHGGGYNTYQIDKNVFEKFEKDISDNFYSWDLALHGPTGQTKYLQNLNNKNKFKPRIIWLETAKIPKFYYYFVPEEASNLLNNKSKKFIFSELNMFNLNYYSRPAPSGLDNEEYMNFRSSKIIGGKFEDCVQKNDILILDSPSHSLMFYLLENKIRFFLVLDEAEEMKLTDNYKKFIFSLKQENLFFYNTEKGLLGKKLQEHLEHKN